MMAPESEELPEEREKDLSVLEPGGDSATSTSAGEHSQVSRSSVPTSPGPCCMARSCEKRTSATLNSGTPTWKEPTCPMLT